MSSTLVASILSEGAKREYDLILFAKYALLKDRILNNVITDQLLQQLSPLSHIPGRDLIELGTPFFWRNVNRCHDPNFKDEEDLKGIRRQLLMAAFDSFFELLPDGTTFMLDAVKNSNIVMPKLGIYIPSSAKEAILYRRNSNCVEVEIPAQKFSIQLNSIEPFVQIPSIKIPNYYQMQILLVNEPSLFGRIDEIGNILANLPDPSELASALSRSFDIINIANHELFLRIIKLIKCFISFPPSDPKIIYSYSLSDLIGVIFFSPSYDQLYLAEVLIHEFHHTELNMLMETQKMLKSKANEGFYSPWRDDPRPLRGLIQGLHAFSSLADFYTRVEKLSTLKIYANESYRKRLNLYYKLKLCLAQVPDDQLTPLGYSIVKSIREFVTRQGVELATSDSGLPVELESHLKKWCERNPELLPRVKKLND